MSSSTALSRELAWLLLLVRRAEASPGPELHSEIDWERFCFFADYHRLSALVCCRLQPCPDSVPSEVLARLQRSARSTAQQNLRLAGELIRILQRLAAEGIRAIPYKGPALSQLLYGDLSLRPSGDLDILVSRPQFESARIALAGLG